ncbi:hypothetical protein [Streptomyces collinus]|nr:hypothetical protein [Streptomyces collinus]UJA06594.1 hypothetical protein HGI10_04760 [Streptomyces collinus]UJA12234.1 hypothetical protein HGI10_62160 [Streptomyces collinus]UJA12899.1 hypothetical protein HGI09_01930 [Streptomyces collinus]UJA18539.1 hypothetical protein HGI09_59330 [Streptomyces collinus]
MRRRNPADLRRLVAREGGYGGHAIPEDEALLRACRKALQEP